MDMLLPSWIRHYEVATDDDEEELDQDLEVYEEEDEEEAKSEKDEKKKLKKKTYFSSYSIDTKLVGTVSSFLSNNSPNLIKKKPLLDLRTCLKIAISSRALDSVKYLFDIFSHEINNLNDSNINKLIKTTFQYPSLEIMKYILLSDVIMKKGFTCNIQTICINNGSLIIIKFFYEEIYPKYELEFDHDYLISIIKKNNFEVFEYLINKFKFKNCKCLLYLMSLVYLHMSDNAMYLVIDHLKSVEFNVNIMKRICKNNNTIYYFINNYPAILHSRPYSKYLMRYALNNSSGTYLLNFLLINKVEIHDGFLTDIIIKDKIEVFIKHLKKYKNKIVKTPDSYFYINSDSQFYFLYYILKIKPYLNGEYRFDTLLFTMLDNNVLNNNGYFDLLINLFTGGEYIDLEDLFGKVKLSPDTYLSTDKVKAFYKNNISIHYIFDDIFFLNKYLVKHQKEDLMFWDYMIRLLYNNFDFELLKDLLYYSVKKNISCFFWLYVNNDKLNNNNKPMEIKNDYMQKLIDEIISMKNSYIFKLSFLDIFINESNLERYCKNTKLKVFCENNLIQYKNIMLKYIENTRKIVEKREKYIVKLCKLDKNIMFNFLPENVNWNIVKYLPEYTLNEL